MKRLTVTPKIKTALAKIDAGLDPATLAIYEATALNTLPVVKRGSLFHGATTSENTLQLMVDYLNNGGNVPLHQIHDQSYALPVGKVFYAEKFLAEGIPSVQILFYLPLTETELVSKVDSSTIDEVSVGFEAGHLLCSECGFDYKGEKATSENFWSQTCDEGHTIGENGVHLNLTGLSGWYETSLVSRGAARGAKIVGRAKSILGETEYNRLAASGHMPDATILFATATAVPSENPMDKELLAQLTAQAGQLSLLQDGAKNHAAALTAVTERATAAEGKLATAEGQVAALTAENATLKSGELATVKTEAAALRAAFSEQVNNACVAAGKPKPAADATVEQLSAALSEARVVLAALPVGGIANQAQSGSGEKAHAHYAAASFATRK